MDTGINNNIKFLRTLTPVHIGTGEQLYPLDYVLDERNNTYYRVSQNVFMRFIRQQKNPDMLLNDYAGWIVTTTEELEELKGTRERNAMQQRSFLQHNFNLWKFCNNHGLQNDFINFLNSQKEIRHYHVRSHHLKNQVRGNLTSGTHKIYIPGSSIKGSIRTALLYNVLMRHDERGYHKKTLLNDIKKRLADRNVNYKQLGKIIGQKAEHSIAYCAKQDENVNIHEEGQFDLFKFLHVSDAVLLGAVEAMEVMNTDIYVVTKVKDRNGMLSTKAGRQSQAPAIEAIKKDTLFALEAGVNLEQLLEVFQKADKKHQWAGIEEKTKALYGIDLNTVNAENMISKKKESDQYIFDAITFFGKAVATFEGKWLEGQYLATELDSAMRLTKEKFRTAFSNVVNYPFGARTMLRLGYGSGFASNTEFLFMIYGNDHETKEVLINMMTRLEIGKKLGYRSTGKAYTPDLIKFPKSRTLATYEETISPLGWLELSNSPFEEKIKRPGEENEIMETIVEVKEIKPEYLSKIKIKAGDILDALFIREEGRLKIFKVYLAKSMTPDTQEIGVNYFADLNPEIVYRVRVTALTKQGMLRSVSFVGMKK